MSPRWGLIAVIGAVGLAFADVPQRIPAHPHPGGTLRSPQVPRVRLVSPLRTPAKVSRHVVGRASSLGGASAYDARKGAAISGSLVHRPRGVAGAR